MSEEGHSLFLLKERKSPGVELKKVENNWIIFPSMDCRWSYCYLRWQFSSASWPGTLLETSSCANTVSTTVLCGPAGPQHLERKLWVPACTLGFPVLVLMTIWPSFYSKKSHKVVNSHLGQKPMVTERRWHTDGHWGLFWKSFKTTSNCHQNKFQRTCLRFSGCFPFKCSKIMSTYPPALGVLNVNLPNERKLRSFYS